MKKFLIFMLIGFGFSLIFTSCQPVKGALSSHFINTPYEITDSFSLFCAENENFYENKVLFAIDQTRSNKKSDPEKIMRKQGVREFIRQNDANNVSYGVIAFSNRVFSPLNLGQDQLDQDPSLSVPAFTSDMDVFEQSLEKVFAKKDEGRGNYSDVLDKVEKGIEYDIRMTPNKIVDYHIIFVSDGSFSVSKDQQRNFANRIQNMTHKFNRVKIHTIYYGDYQNRSPGMGPVLGRMTKATFRLGVYYLTGIPPFIYSSPYPVEGDSSISEQETDDVRYLKNVSDKGQGVYIDQNQNVNWGLDLSQEWDTNSFVVYNLNAGFCLEDGRVGLDSDMDGLCDKDEEKMNGFEPDNRFSFDDGYGDYFHWLALNSENSYQLPDCQDQEDKDYDLLTSCEEAYINSIASQDPFLTALNVNNPDSDKDGILDGIEVLVYLSTNKLAARDPYNLDVKSDGLTEYQKIVKHISPFVPVKDQIPYDTSLFPVKGENSTCYSLRQTKLPLYPTLPVDKNDTLSQISQNPGDNTLLIYTFKRSKNTNSNIYQFMYRSIQDDFEGLSLPVKGNSFRYLAFTHSSQN